MREARRRAGPGDGRVCPARHTDPGTAHVAAAANAEIRASQRGQVMAYLISQGEKGATDYETSVAVGILRSSSSKRRFELVELGLVGSTGRRRPTDTGSTAIVWADAMYLPEALLDTLVNPDEEYDGAAE